MKMRSCLVVCEEGGASPFHVLEELENGVILALRPSDTARIFGAELPVSERLRLIEDCLVGIHPAENRFLAFFELKGNLSQAKSLLLRMLIDE